MKNHPLFKLIMVFAAIFSLISCENEPLEGEFGETPEPLIASFKVDIDGQTFVADHSTAITVLGRTTIAGVKNDGEAVTLSFSGAGIGNYSLFPSNLDGSATYLPADDSNLYLNEFENDTIAKIEISKYDIENHVVSGTFEFIASRYLDPEDESLGTETKVFNNGTFENVPLQTDINPEPEVGIFQVELDGELLVGETITASLNADGLKINATNGIRQIGFQIFDPQLGSFSLLNDEDALVIYDPDITDDESLAYHTSDGTINITSLDMANGKVSGDFSGILTEFFGSAADIEMTNGIFQDINFSTTASPDSASALINGEPFDATIFPVVFVSGTIQVNFSNDLDEEIRIIFPENVSEGIYPVTAPPAMYSATYTIETAPGTEMEYDAIPDSGEIIITSVVNEVVKGTFHFQVENSTGEIIDITEGEFIIDVSF